MNNLHGIPGIMGGIISAIACSHNSINNFGANYSEHFPELLNGRTTA